MPAELLHDLLSLSHWRWAVYLAVFLPVGFFMNEFGKWTGIACFGRWWQVLTCYGAYVAPVAVALRSQPFHLQYLWGFFFMGLLELLGYALGTSVALGIVETGNSITIGKNILVRWLNIKNFSLAMAIFFALYIPALNWLVGRIFSAIG